MEIKVMQGDLVEGLKYIKNFINKSKDANAVDKSILLEVISEAPAILRLRCNDKSTWASVDIPLAFTDFLGKFPLIDSDKFIGYLLTTLKKDEITITNKDGIIHVRSKAEKSRPKFSTMIGDYFLEPDVSSEKEYILNAENFKKGINKAAEITPITADRLTDICIAVTINKNVMMFEARQLISNIMASYMLVNNMQKEEKGIRVIMDCHKLKSILSGFDNDDITMTMNDNFILFHQGTKKAYIKKVFGKISPFNHMFPKTTNDVKYVFTCQREDIYKKSIRVDKLMSDSLKVRYCDITFKNTEGYMVSDGGKSEVKEFLTFSGTEDCEAIKRFSISSMIKIINLCESEEISFYIPKESNHIFVFSQKDKGSMLKLIIPLLAI